MIPAVLLLIYLIYTTADNFYRITMIKKVYLKLDPYRTIIMVNWIAISLAVAVLAMLFAGKYTS